MPFIDRKTREAAEAHVRRIQSSRMGDLAAPELFQAAQKWLAADRGRFASSQTPYPKYPGPTIAPMSSMTARADTLENGWANRPKPYTNKLNTVLARPNAGIAPDRLASAIRSMEENNTNFGRNVGVHGLQHQFGHAYNSRVPNVHNILGGDVERLSAEHGERLRDTSNSAAALEGTRNQTLAKLLKSMQDASLGRRETLTGSLRKYGTQEQGHMNMVNDANRQEFMRQANAPHENMNRLQDALKMYQESGTFDEGGHPDLQKPYGRELAQALRAYGIDTNAPVSTWGNEAMRRTTPGYTGQLVAPQAAETVASHSLMNRMEPSFTNENTPERRRLTQGLMDRGTIGDEAIQRVPGSISSALHMQNHEGSRRLSQQMAELTNKYLKLGQYGSPQHMSEAEEATRRVSQATGENRNSAFQGGLTNEIRNAHHMDSANIGRVAGLADQENREWNQAHGDIEQLNSQGANRWQNAQNQNEELYRNFQGESGWAWPHLREQIRRDVGNNANRQLAGSRSMFNDLAGAHAGVQQQLGDVQGMYQGALGQVNQLQNAVGAAEERARALEAANRQAEQGAQQERQRRQQIEGQNRAESRPRHDQLENIRREQEFSSWILSHPEIEGNRQEVLRRIIAQYGHPNQMQIGNYPAWQFTPRPFQG